MSERIRELAEQAAKFSAIMALPAGESGDKLFVEKFAELIVKETMQVVANNLPQNTYLDVADAVIEHFKE